MFGQSNFITPIPHRDHENQYTHRPFWRLGLLSVFAMLFGMDAQAAQVKTRADYVINLAGINVASLNINFTDNGSRYTVGINADVMGAGNLVAKGSASANSSGNSTGRTLNAQDFVITTIANGDKFSVDVDYANGNATAFRVDPPIVNNIGRIAVERKHLRGVADPIASFIIKGDALDASLCDRRLKIFTGMERYDLNMSFAATQTATSTRTGYQGPVILCRMQYKPVSGHFKSSEMTQYLANSDKILIWYAPLRDTGYYIPYRILMGTSVGDLSMVLTKLN